MNPTTLVDLFPSKFLSQNDVPQPIILTIARVAQEEMKDRGGTVKKPVVYFVSNAKPWILNKGNAKRIAALYGSDIAAWTGKSVEIYTDPMVEFGGEIVGGLRLRAPQSPAPPGVNPSRVVQVPVAPATTQPTPGASWDVWDGTTTAKMTTEQIWSLVAGGADPAKLRVRIPGTSKGGTAVEYGFTLAEEPSGAIGDEIPW